MLNHVQLQLTAPRVQTKIIYSLLNELA